MASQQPPAKNFWLWGKWGKRRICPPFCTQKVHGKIRDVIIGHTFIIALTEDGKLMSWGEDKTGCLGQGTDLLHTAEPTEIRFTQESEKNKIIEVQHGKHHILALTDKGKVFAWGENQHGQLGQNDLQTRFDPVFVDELKNQTVKQILAIDSASYALTSSGLVYAWGENVDGSLALEHDSKKVMKPEPMLTMKDTPVKKLQVKECGGSGGGKGGKTIIAFVELADELREDERPGGFERPLGAEPKRDDDQAMESNSTERDIFEGVDLMRRVMDNTQDWFKHMMEVRHGSPYDDAPGMGNDSMASKAIQQDHCTALQLDRHVSLDVLERAAHELDMLVQSAKAQLQEIRSKKGTKNVKFMLMMFMDDCKLRREKIKRTVNARQLMDYKRAYQGYGTDGNNKNELDRLQDASTNLTRTSKRVRDMTTDDVFTRALQDSLAESIELKLQVFEHQIQSIKSGGYTGTQSMKEYEDLMLPALQTIKERWKKLKEFSIANLYGDFTERHGGSNIPEDEMLAYLVQTSDQKIDQIISTDRNSTISRDLLVPRLCYELLTENAELRKMCNTYQLKVLQQKTESDRMRAQSRMALTQ